MIITLSGDPGSGKSTVAKILAQQLNLKHYSMGDMRGKIAIDLRLTIDELNKRGESESFTDKDVDEYQKKLGKQEDNFIVDGRLSFYFIPNSYKIYLKVDGRVAAQRIFNAPKRADERLYSSIDDVLNATKARVESDKKRYQKYYGIDYTNATQYDLVIDTTNNTPAQIADKIILELKKKELVKN